MKTNELNKYIKHYLENDKTKSAIMLNAPWGTGKSFYIQNTLRKYLMKDNSDRCIVVSLYGMKDLSEISKSLYLEIRVKPIKEKASKKWETLIKKSKTVDKHSSEIVATITNGGKTIVKGLTGYFGIDLSADENLLQKLYESIDLSGKLIILEDMERSEIDLTSLMGYVNNLVEQDGVKVMLVANEDEIMKKQTKEVETKEQEEKLESYQKLGLDNRPYTVETKEYLRTKEKTISDTIKFEGDYIEAIPNIINSFENSKLSEFISDACIEELVDILQNKNLRSFIYACQKTVDIYEVLPDDLEYAFAKTIFWGIVIYSLRMKSGEILKWDGDKNLSVTLGNSNYPLFRFCYNYIWEQTIELETVDEAANALKDLRLYDRHQSKTDEDLNAIYSFYLQSESALTVHLDNIEQRLQNPDDISYYEYGKLANYVVALTDFVDYNISLIKTYIINNLSGKGDRINEYFLFHSSTQIVSEEKKEEFAELKRNMIHALNEKQGLLWGFDYNASSIKKLYESVVEHESEIRSKGKFISLFDLDKLISMLKICSSSEIEDIRHIFYLVYHYHYNKDNYGNERSMMELLLGKVHLLMEENNIDRIQKLQLKWFSDNLAEYIQKLS